MNYSMLSISASIFLTIVAPQFSAPEQEIVVLGAEMANLKSDNRQKQQIAKAEAHLATFRQLEGTWKAHTGEKNGIAITDKELKTILTQLVFRPANVAWSRTSGTEEHRFNFDLHESGIQIAFGDTAKTARKALVHVKDNTLTMCIHHPSQTSSDTHFPKSTSERSPSLLVIQLQRVEAGPKR